MYKHKALARGAGTSYQAGAGNSWFSSVSPVPLQGTNGKYKIIITNIMNDE